MIGGSISRYHTPQMGRGFANDLIKVAGPLVVGALQRSVKGVQQGKKAQDAFAQEATRLKGNLKRKTPHTRHFRLNQSAGRLSTTATTTYETCPNHGVFAIPLSARGNDDWHDVRHLVLQPLASLPLD